MHFFSQNQKFWKLFLIFEGKLRILIVFIVEDNIALILFSYYKQND